MLQTNPAQESGRSTISSSCPKCYYQRAEQTSADPKDRPHNRRKQAGQAYRTAIAACPSLFPTISQESGRSTISSSCPKCYYQRAEQTSADPKDRPHNRRKQAGQAYRTAIAACPSLFPTISQKLTRVLKLRTS
ncbi:hypothetical protein OROGR_031034 [Orobanche gracilis]